MRLENNFIQDIIDILKTARQKAHTSVNSLMVEAYWLIGHRIVKEEQLGEKRAEYGIYMIKELSKKLSREFGKGFSIANLKNFRQFYLTFPDGIKGYTASSQLSWSHFRLIMRVENPNARAFYMAESFSQNWSVRLLERNVNSLYYERILSSKDKFYGLSKKKDSSPTDFIKDPYILEFLGIENPISMSENDMETAIINKIQKFLLELGKGFAFIGRQYKIQTETKLFYIDLVFYNYILKCFVLVDLKITQLTHQDIGQMDMYVRMFEDLNKIAGDNPTMGIILCSDKDDTVVKYSVLNENRKLFASKYSLYLPTEEELAIEIEKIRMNIY